MIRNWLPKTMIRNSPLKAIIRNIPPKTMIRNLPPKTTIRNLPSKRIWCIQEMICMKKQTGWVMPLAVLNVRMMSNVKLLVGIIRPTYVPSDQVLVMVESMIRMFNPDNVKVREKKKWNRPFSKLSMLKTCTLISQETNFSEKLNRDMSKRTNRL